LAEVAAPLGIDLKIKSKMTIPKKIQGQANEVVDTDIRVLVQKIGRLDTKSCSTGRRIGCPARRTPSLVAGKEDCSCTSRRCAFIGGKEFGKKCFFVRGYLSSTFISDSFKKI